MAKEKSTGEDLKRCQLIGFRPLEVSDFQERMKSLKLGGCLLDYLQCQVNCKEAAIGCTLYQLYPMTFKYLLEIKSKVFG